jgi:hypothetical protein
MERHHAMKAAGLLVVVGAVALVTFSVGGGGAPARAELLSPLQVGRYAVRAERQGGDYDQKAERQIAFATDNDNAASGERDLAAKEEKRARDSAYLAADTKSRIDKVLEAGRDQVLPRAAGLRRQVPQRGIHWSTAGRDSLTAGVGNPSRWVWRDLPGLVWTLSCRLPGSRDVRVHLESCLWLLAAAGSGRNSVHEF